MERSAELEALALRISEAMTSIRPNEAYEALSRDEGVMSIWTDAREVYRGHDNIRAIAARQVEEAQASRSPTSPPPEPNRITDISAYRIGEAGWATVLQESTTPTGRVTMRTTFVFQLEGAQWRLLHDHWSIGITNEDVYATAFTTSLDDIAERVSDERPDVGAATAADGTVTLLFSDIEGSTALLAELGDRRYKDLLQWHNHVARSALAEIGGHEVSWQGDGFMLAFGSARRALRCASTIQERTSADNPEHVPLRLRMGVHTGEALRDRDDFFGHVVQYAARVASSAVGGEVLCSGVVRQLLTGDDEWEFIEQPPKQFKGFVGDQTVYAVTRRSGQRS